MLVQPRKESADGDVINLLPAARPGVGGEPSQVTAVGFDGVRRGIALAQVTEKIRDGFLDYG